MPTVASFVEARKAFEHAFQAMLDAALQLRAQVLPAGTTPSSLGIDTIQASVARFYGLPIDVMTLHTRRKAHLRGRMVAMFLSRKLTNLDSIEIGLAFGRTRSDVNYVFKSVTEWMSIDDTFADEVRLLENRLVASSLGSSIPHAPGSA